jgi:HEPN domain-containing protein
MEPMFHAQQSVEKALKAVLTARRATFPRTHNLEELGLLVAESGIGLPAPTTEFRRLILSLWTFAMTKKRSR